MTLGEKILDLRRRNAMSQDVLAEKLEVSRQAVSKWERDEAVPETDKIVRMAQLFRVSTDYLLLDSEPQKEQPQPAPQQPRAEDRIERFVGRHGYKVGYIMMAVGAFICVLSIGMRLLWPVIAGQFFSGAFEGFGDVLQSNNQITISDMIEYVGGFPGTGVIVDENGNTFDSFEEMLGIGNYGDPFGEFAQLDQIANRHMSSAITAQANMFLIGLLPGGLLIAAGAVIVVKGKKLAQQTEN